MARMGCSGNYFWGPSNPAQHECQCRQCPSIGNASKPCRAYAPSHDRCFLRIAARPDLRCPAQAPCRAARRPAVRCYGRRFQEARRRGKPKRLTCLTGHAHQVGGSIAQAINEGSRSLGSSRVLILGLIDNKMFPPSLECKANESTDSGEGPPDEQSAKRLSKISYTR